MFHGTLDQFNVLKATDLYKAIDIEINIGADEPMDDEQKETSHNTGSNGLTADSNIILEEFTGFRTDIDRLKGKLKVKSHVYEAKKLSNELMVIRSFKTVNNKILDVNKKEEKTDFGLGLAKKFIKKLETVRLTEYIEVPKAKEDQVKSYYKSPEKSPNRSPQKAQSILITRPPGPASLSKKMVSMKDSQNSISHNSFLKSGTIPDFSASNSKNNSPLRLKDKKALTTIRQITSGNQNNFPVENRGYLMENKMDNNFIGQMTPENKKNKSNILIKLETITQKTELKVPPKTFTYPSMRELGSGLIKNPSIRDLGSDLLSQNKLPTHGAIKGHSMKDLGVFSYSKLPPPIPVEKIRKNLYPLSFKDLDESKLEAKAKTKKFNNEFIEKSDKFFCLHAAEILSNIIKNAIENYDHPKMKKLIELSGKDYSLLLTAMFQPDDALFFSLIFEVEIF